jgi:hypothetical protein
MFLNGRVLRWVVRFLIAVSLLLLAAAVGAQTPPTPDLSGTWKLVDFGGSKDTSDRRFPKMTLIIEQQSSEIRITEKRIKRGKEEVRTFVYYLDGRGETNTSRVEVWRRAEPRFETVTRTEKGRIVTEYKRELYWGTGSAPWETASRQENQWTVNASGQKLILTAKVRNVNSGLITGKTGEVSGLPAAEWFNSKLTFRRI